ncbi:MAG: nucleotide exchange factor GrpE [Sulfobacillus acidophilus]|uniref:Protein GrpE n=1 Tax=Sulfobacillus acidophilus TaxID=53633 RepID=A0A2T2WN44_9FIRM|nr:MAG: nucleotide exchange factor GrpE [Sulfobacillus acidophilus]
MNDETPKDAQTQWEDVPVPETDQPEARADEDLEEPAAEGESEEPPTDWEAVARSRYEQLVRLQADFENFRRRMERERNDIQGHVAERLLGDLLPVFDNLERALKYMPTEGEAKNWRVGVEMTLNGFLEALARLGVTPIVAVGASFDPRFHEAVEQVPSEEPEGTVVEELKRGFTWNDRVLRASLVKVSTGDQ